MTTSFSLPIYQQRRGKTLVWTPLGLGPHAATRRGRSKVKLQQGLADALKKLLRELDLSQLWRLQLSDGIHLSRPRLELNLRPGSGRRKFSGTFPLVIQPLPLGPGRRMQVAYHPLRQQQWFPLPEEGDLAEAATLYLSRAWAELPEETLRELLSDGRDRIKVIAISARLPSLLDALPGASGGVWDDLELSRGKGGAPREAQKLKVLREVGVDQTARAVEGTLPAGVPRSPYREQLGLLLGGKAPRSTLVVGPPQVGKTTLLNRWVRDLLEADGFTAHRNLDRVRHVFRLGGQRLISGMSYLGDWEQRCLELVAEARANRVLLWVDDLPAFSRLGRTRDSERNLADVFRGPLARGELTVVGECTPEQLQRLEQDAPSFAAAFSRVHVEPTGKAETLRLLLHELRQLELAGQRRLDPTLLRPVLDLSSALFPAAALPGKALDLLRALCRSHRDEAEPEITFAHLLELLSARTGLPPELLSSAEPLDPQELRRELSLQVMGQPEAIEAACDLALRIRAGLTDPARPYGVYLFTGPTGTGKTELAKSLAHYLYGDPARLVRFDMGEFSGPDAVARLVGDRLQPRGLLVQQVARQPFCLLLLDEIEKAHPQVLGLMLQLFDEGRLSDAEGTTADFTQAVVVMTSNLGARSQAPIGFSDSPEAVLAEVARAVREFFPPELFGRIDRVIRFRPLSRQVARRIAEKELTRLLARRGLTDRNILVQPSQGVIDRTVERGFDPLYGARTVKRFLEDEVGTLLARQVAAGPRAALQVQRVYADARAGGAFALHVEALTEAESRVTALPLEPLLDEPIGELRQRLGGAMDALDALLEGEEAQALEQRIGEHLASLSGQGGEGEGEGDDGADPAEALYNLEAMRLALRGLRGKLGFLKARPSADREELLRVLAEVHFMGRALRQVHDPGRHAVLVALSRPGLARQVPRFRAGSEGGTLAHELLRAYLRRRLELEQFALWQDGGPARGDDPEALLRLVARGRPETVVLKLSGLGALDLLAGEHGCHIWRSLAHGPQVLRVAVRPAPGAAGAEEEFLRLRRGAARFEQALEAGVSPLPENPRRLLPLVREYRYDPPGRAGGSAPLDLSDYGLGYATTLHCRSLAEGLERLWLLRISREEG